MKNSLLLLALTGGFAMGQLDLSVAGLQVVKEGYEPEGEKKANDFGSGLRAFNWNAGTRVALMVKSGEKAIVSLDKEGSKVATFSDDQGTDFRKAKSSFGREGADFGFASYSDDKKAFLIDVETSGVPKTGAGELILKGELLVSMASKSKLEKSERVEAKEGSEVKVAKHEFKVSKAGKPEWGSGEFAMTLKGSSNPQDFKAFVFYSADGKELKAERKGSGSMGMFGKMTYEVTYHFEKKVDQFTLGLDGWTDLEKVKVPFDLKVKAGL